MDKETRNALTSLNRKVSLGIMEACGHTILFADEWINPEEEIALKCGWKRYPLRHGDSGDEYPATIEKSVLVNFWGMALSPEPLDFGDAGYIGLTSGDVEGMCFNAFDTLGEEEVFKSFGI